MLSKIAKVSLLAMFPLIAQAAELKIECTNGVTLSPEKFVIHTVGIDGGDISGTVNKIQVTVGGNSLDLRSYLDAGVSCKVIAE